MGSDFMGSMQYAQQQALQQQALQQQALLQQNQNSITNPKDNVNVNVSTSTNANQDAEMGGDPATGGAGGSGSGAGVGAVDTDIDGEALDEGSGASGSSSGGSGSGSGVGGSGAGSGSVQTIPNFDMANFASIMTSSSNAVAAALATAMESANVKLMKELTTKKQYNDWEKGLISLMVEKGVSREKFEQFLDEKIEQKDLGLNIIQQQVWNKLSTEFHTKVSGEALKVGGSDNENNTLEGVWRTLRRRWGNASGTKAFELLEDFVSKSYDSSKGNMDTFLSSRFEMAKKLSVNVFKSPDVAMLFVLGYRLGPNFADAMRMIRRDYEKHCKNKEGWRAGKKDLEAYMADPAGVNRKIETQSTPVTANNAVVALDTANFNALLNAATASMFVKQNNNNNPSTNGVPSSSTDVDANYNNGKSSYWCNYRYCKGDRSSHSESHCFDKKRDQEYQNSRNNNKDGSGKGAKQSKGKGGKSGGGKKEKKGGTGKGKGGGGGNKHGGGHDGSRGVKKH